MPDNTQQSWVKWNAAVFNHFQMNDRDARRPWHTRETNAQSTRPMLGWHAEQFWREMRCIEIYKYHFPHGAYGSQALIAYTVDDDKGSRDIQTQIKPGRYLRQYFSDILSEKETAHYAAMHLKYEPIKTPWDDFDVHFATTPDEIAWVYTHGPYSCMQNQFREADHPTRAYAAGDLAIAYLKQADRVRNSDNAKHHVLARALCWPEKKVVGRAYPTPDNFRPDGFASFDDASKCQNVLLTKLRTLGYKSVADGKSTFEGARILRLPVGGRRDHFWAPFLDNAYRFGLHAEDPEQIILTQIHARWSGSTNGTIHIPRPYARHCDRCSTGYDENPTSVLTYVYRAEKLHSNWCPVCAAHQTFTCQINNELCDYGISQSAYYGEIRKYSSPTAVKKWKAEREERLKTEREALEAEFAARRKMSVGTATNLLTPTRGTTTTIPTPSRVWGGNVYTTPPLPAYEERQNVYVRTMLAMAPHQWAPSPEQLAAIEAATRYATPIVNNAANPTPTGRTRRTRSTHWVHDESTPFLTTPIPTTRNEGDQ